MTDMFLVDASHFAEEWAGQADWRRRKAAEYPDDSRNQEAAELWERLAAAASENAILPELLETYSRIASDEDGASKLFEAQNQVYLAVGFHDYPDTPDALLIKVIERAGFGAISPTSRTEESTK